MSKLFRKLVVPWQFTSKHGGYLGIGGKRKRTHTNYSKVRLKLIKNIRRQLTLFVNPKDAEIIELVRQEFNPRQFALIKSHVTLCREDEIENLEQVISNLNSLTDKEIVIGFAKATRFDNGKGLLLPALTDNIDFQDLRRQVLGGLNDNPRKQEAHITLMHPRNSTCTDAIFRQIERLSLPKQLSFKKISLIEQEDGGHWNILQDFELSRAT